MADDPTKQPEASAEDEALIKRVDDMMAPVRRNLNPAPPQGPYQPKKIEPDTLPRPSTAPPLKGVYKPKTTYAKPPLVIKLADAEATPKTESLTVDKAAELAASSSEAMPTEPFGDQKTDQAVDDIAAKESDTILAVEDARVARKTQAVNSQPGRGAKLKALLKNKWIWLGLLIVLLAVFAWPNTRYRLLGLFLKEPVNVTVLDSQTSTPVSGAVIRLAGASAKTNAAGHAQLNAPLGSHALQVSKQYYTLGDARYFVGFKSGQSTSLKLVATGRLVPVSVLNSISGKPLADVQVKIKDTSAKTNAQGQANIALPVSSSVLSGSLSSNGYNSSTISLQVTNQNVAANHFQLTPAGHIYFLSNASGKIDVVKTNLDGSGRQTVLAGTGHEDASTISLLASRDWRYLVLKSTRDGGQPALYLIDTSNDKITEFENSGGDISLAGWSGHNFVYDLTKTSQSYWQAGRESLKAYDADHQQLNQLDQNQAEGSASLYAYQNFDNFYIINNLVVYSTRWSTFAGSSASYNTAGKSDSIRAVQSNGQNKRDYQTFDVNSTGGIQAQAYLPQAIYFAVYDQTNGSNNYYDYENQTVKTASINNGTFTATYPTYLVSPNGNQTFWNELVDGQTTLFTGDDNANSKKQVNVPAGYSAYGWFGNYLLASKNGSQLYILPANGLDSGRQPLKITAYYKPAQTYSGYGYGYGGL